MIRRNLTALLALGLAPVCFADDSYKYNYTFEGPPMCDSTSGVHSASPDDLDGFIREGDTIETWRFLIWRGFKIVRPDRGDWRFRIRNSDRKDIFATIRLPEHGAAGSTGATELHCGAVEYAGFDPESGRHFVDFFLQSMNPGDKCDAKLIDEHTKTQNRNSGSCLVGHNGSGRGFFP